ncbi:sigma-54 interaction domain-containing protein [Desulfosediminicola flagellatus]|uniref:sigma-54 interaction domain-containing protein n=1 Tax=Desulfosediminicola flagellatus TaxID=2569541 RepID=UPI0010ABBAC4|nr:sigma 54-interacting transcriptional regulator [Desulfosediminicola flagellatus]
MEQYSEILSNNVINILEALDDGVYVTDKAGTTLHVNEMYEKLTGLKRTDLLGQNVRILREKGVFDFIANPKVVETLKPVNNVQVLKSGKRVVLRGFPVFDVNNELALVITLVRDVTLIGQMREQILQQKKLISIYHNQIEHLSTGSKVESASYESAQIKQLSELVKRVASTDATILLLGETGVGKDWYARMAHENSPRKDEVFLKVDCGSISENLIESELFGYAPGAFTGASRQGKIGHFEIANKGTVFLDEIGELPLTMQAKLLRVLQDQEVMRVGSSVPQKVDVRIIAATNRNLEQEVANGNFRIDLFYRLRVAVVDIPPLREVREMIPGLVNHFLERFRSKYKKDIVCHDDTMNIFMAYRWPGNIRELENTIQSLVVTCQGHEILPEDLSPCMQAASYEMMFTPAGTLSGGSGRSLKAIMADFEKQVIQQALDRYGSVNEASSALGINRTTLFRKMRD